MKVGPREREKKSRKKNIKDISGVWGIVVLGGWVGVCVFFWGGCWIVLG